MSDIKSRSFIAKTGYVYIVEANYAQGKAMYAFFIK